MWVWVWVCRLCGCAWVLVGVGVCVFICIRLYSIHNLLVCDEVLLLWTVCRRELPVQDVCMYTFTNTVYTHAV